MKDKLTKDTRYKLSYGFGFPDVIKRSYWSLEEGHEKGAFTDAKSLQEGLFKQSNRGTAHTLRGQYRRLCEFVKGLTFIWEKSNLK